MLSMSLLVISRFVKGNLLGRLDDVIRDRVGPKPGLRGRDSATVIVRLSSLLSPLTKGENYHTKSSKQIDFVYSLHRKFGDRVLSKYSVSRH